MEAESTVAELRRTFESGRTRSLEWRLSQLRALRRMLSDNRDQWIEAIEASTLKPRSEAIVGEYMGVESEVDHMIANVASWCAPSDVPTPLALMPATSRIERQPFGVVLVIGPSNYPMLLALSPLAGALAAGNAALLKPSELCPEVCDLFVSLVKAYLDPEAVAVVTGDASVCAELLSQKWDHIIFTGSERVGKIVAAAAAKHLTPVTLELGGKCPVVVDRNAEPLPSIAYKLVWGRLFNGGQSCVAPEYVLVPRESLSALTAELVRTIRELYTDDPQACAHLGRVASEASASRISQLLVGHGGTIACGGTVDAQRRYVSPTLIVEPHAEAPILRDEVFGPVLCLLPYDTLDGAIDYIRRQPGTPLAMYGFTCDAAVERRLLDEIPSGNAMFNDVLVHFANPNVPFGGLGWSGMGSLHGKFYFDVCTQQRGVMTKPAYTAAARMLDLQVWLRAAPYHPTKTEAIRTILTYLNVNLPPAYARRLALLVLLVVLVFAMRASGLHIVCLRRAARAVLDAVGP